MQAQSAGALGTAYSLIGHDNVMRINQTVTRGKFALDSAKEIADLCALGRNRARNESAKINPVFLREPAEPFVPCKQV